MHATPYLRWAPLLRAAALACLVWTSVASSPVAAQLRTGLPADGASLARSTTSGGSRASPDDRAEPPVDVVLNFRYSDAVRSDLTVRYVDGQPYLPLGRTFSLLHIDWRFDREALEFRGFFLDERRRYALRFRDGNAIVEGEAFDVAKGDFVADEDEIFVQPLLLRKLFGIEISIDERDLTVFVESSEELPPSLSRRRARERPLLADPYAALRHAPLAFGRSRKWLGGGVADYGLSVSTTGDEAQVDVQGAAGLEVFGGDLSWSGRAGRQDAAYIRQDWLRWRYVNDENPMLRQVRLGTLSSTGLRPTPYEGLHLTNQTASSKVFFGSYQVTGEIEPDWEVELYLNDRLVGLADADASGHYRFDLPLVYGTSLLHVRTFGPNGEVRDQRRRIQVPFTMMVPGELNYNAYAGRDARLGGAVLQGDVAYGLSERLTIKAGADRVPGFDDALLYGSMTARFFTHFLGSATATTRGLHALSVNGYLPSKSTVQLRYDRLEAPRHFPLRGDRRRLSASAFVPFDVAGRSSSLRLDGSRVDDGDEHEYGVRGYLSSRFGRLQMYMNVHTSWSEQYHRATVSPALAFTFDRRTSPLPFLSGTLVTARARYEASSARMQSVEVSASRNVARRTRIRFLANLGFGSRSSSLGLRLSVDLPYAQTSTEARTHGAASRVVQHVRGSLSWDRHNGQVFAGSRPAVGRSSAAVRMFVDRNGNGSLDRGEYVLDDQAVYVERSSVTASRKRGSRVTHLSDLMPYEQYTLRVDETAIANPLWVPARRAFSFVADPNSVKPIDIPLYGSGIVEGTVHERLPTKNRALGGIVVQLVHSETGDIRELRTFSDGSFYEMGLPPGTYEIRLDVDQLASQELEIVSAAPSFEIRTGDESSLVDDLAFVVGPRAGPEETLHLATTLPADPLPASALKPLRPHPPAVEHLAALPDDPLAPERLVPLPDNPLAPERLAPLPDDPLAAEPLPPNEPLAAKPLPSLPDDPVTAAEEDLLPLHSYAEMLRPGDPVRDRRRRPIASTLFVSLLCLYLMRQMVDTYRAIGAPA